MSNSLHVASSDPVANACPLGKNCSRLRKANSECHFVMKNGNRILLKTYRYCIDVSFMSSECLSADATPDIPELYKRKTMVSNNRRYLDILQVQTTTATQCIQYSYLS